MPDHSTLDSLAVLEVIRAIEDRFGLQVDDDDLSGELFEAIATLADYVDSKRENVS
jgi:acyl carrier protein